MRCNCKQQRARARHNYSLAPDGKAALHQSLQSASPEDSRQRPSWKREKPFPSPGGQNQLFEVKLFHEGAVTSLVRGLHSSRCLGAEHAAASEHLGSGPPKPFQRSPFPAVATVRGSSFSDGSFAPYLAACSHVVVEHDDGASILGCRRRRSDPGWASPDHQNFRGCHRLASIVMSCSHRIWQVRRCGIPFTTARHSKQTPMPQSAPRGSPVTDIRLGRSASNMAAATVVPRATRLVAPLIFTERSSNMSQPCRFHESRRQVGAGVDRRLAPKHCIHQQPGGARSICNTKSFKPRGQP
jgi:hypothetical protein